MSINIAEISRKSGLNYHTTRKYLMALQSKGIKELPEIQLISILRSIKELTSKGYTVNESIDLILKEDQQKKTTDEMFMILEKKINDLEKENRALKELIQVYLSRIDKLEQKIDLIPQALPKPREPFWKKITKLFKG